MRLLFVKHSLLWPRSNGHDVHTFYMMKACAELGHEVWLATVVPPEPPAVDGLKLAGTIRLSAPLADDNLSIDDTWFQRRFRSFWGVDEHWILALRQAVARIKPAAVIVAGMDALPFLVPLKNTIRVWYAADELVWHHLSQLTWSPSTWRRHGTNAAYRLMYERSHRKIVDRAWVVSDIDARAMRRIAGVATIDVLPNGVDSVFFAPGREIPRDRSAVFWGRLDFGPNIQALEWFVSRVWPIVRQRVPDAQFTIIGFQPTAAVKALATKPGVALYANVRDLRGQARSHALAVLPLVSGAGIKNKLLEAAALGLPIVGTPTAALGLRGNPPLTIGRTPAELAAAIADIWADPARRAKLGADSRAWVLEQHTWRATALEAIEALRS